VASLLAGLGIRAEQVAVELNLQILERHSLAGTYLQDGYRVELIGFVGGGSAIMQDVWGDDRLTIAGIEFSSRLWVGTGKYKNFAETQKAIEAAGAEAVTVAVRRVNITDRSSENLLDYLNPKKYKILPNTAGCYTVEEALRYARLARASGVSDMVKLEVIGDEKTLFPDTAGLIEAARILVKEGFIVLPYTNDDPIVAKRLVDIGCPAVMPLAAPIGSGLGIRNPYNLKILMESVKVPVIVDAGVGTASDAVLAMEYGADAVLMNTAIAGAKEPLLMAEAMKHAIWAGRLAFRAGRIPRKLYATASSPIEGML
jgi:thiazole synthase